MNWHFACGATVPLVFIALIFYGAAGQAQISDWSSDLRHGDASSQSDATEFHGEWNYPFAPQRL
jgi:hypothetical protein